METSTHIWVGILSGLGSFMSIAFMVAYVKCRDNDATSDFAVDLLKMSIPACVGLFCAALVVVAAVQANCLENKAVLELKIANLEHRLAETERKPKGNTQQNKEEAEGTPTDTKD